MDYNKVRDIVLKKGNAVYKFVFHTSKDELTLTIVQNHVYRGINSYENSI